jgi:hypothetical protein
LSYRDVEELPARELRLPGYTFGTQVRLTASSVSLGWGSEAGATQHPAHGGRADPMPEATQLTMHAAKSPAGILDTQDQDLDVLGSRGARQQHQPPKEAGGKQVEHLHKHER